MGRECRDVPLLLLRRRRLAAAVAAVGKDQGYAFILNTDNDACPYVNPEMGEDATELIKAQLTK